MACVLATAILLVLCGAVNNAQAQGAQDPVRQLTTECHAQSNKLARSFVREADPSDPAARDPEGNLIYSVPKRSGTAFFIYRSAANDIYALTARHNIAPTSASSVVKIFGEVAGTGNLLEFEVYDQWEHLDLAVLRVTSGSVAGLETYRIVDADLENERVDLIPTGFRHGEDCEDITARNTSETAELGSLVDERAGVYLLAAIQVDGQSGGPVRNAVDEVVGVLLERTSSSEGRTRFVAIGFAERELNGLFPELDNASLVKAESGNLIELAGCRYTSADNVRAHILKRQKQLSTNSYPQLVLLALKCDDRLVELAFSILPKIQSSHQQDACRAAIFKVLGDLDKLSALKRFRSDRVNDAHDWAFPVKNGQAVEDWLASVNGDDAKVSALARMCGSLSFWDYSVLGMTMQTIIAIIGVVFLYLAIFFFRMRVLHF